jgi:hypothetical protein
MNPDIIIQLRRQLEALKEFERNNASRKSSYLGYWGEFLVGIVLLGKIVAWPTPDFPLLGQVTYYLFGIALTSQGFYLILRFKFDKRIRLLLEAVLSIGEIKQP